MWIYIIIAIIVLIVIYALALYNSFVKLNNKVKEAFSTMDVYLKKRWDLIPNIVETVKGYAKHEKDTLKEVVELRNSTYDKMSDDEILNYVTNNKENYLYEEERRLFYVALTRTRNTVSMLVPINSPSIFVREIIEDNKMHINVVN